MGEYIISFLGILGVGAVILWLRFECTNIPVLMIILLLFGGLLIFVGLGGIIQTVLALIKKVTFVEYSEMMEKKEVVNPYTIAVMVIAISCVIFASLAISKMNGIIQ